TTGTDSATVTIADGGTPLVSVTASDAVAAEAGPDAGAFTVTRTGPTDLALTVYYSVGGSADRADYETLSGSVGIPQGASSATVPRPPVDDAAYEGDETGGLTLTAGTGYALSSPLGATASISDDEPVPQISFTQPVYSAGEGDGQANVTLSLSQAAQA